MKHPTNQGASSLTHENQHDEGETNNTDRDVANKASAQVRLLQILSHAIVKDIRGER